MEQDTSRYLELEIEDEVNVIRTGGGDDIIALAERTLAGNVEITDLKKVGSFAFVGCKDLLTISLPKCETVEDYGFSFMDEYASQSYACTNLTTVDLPQATTFGSSAFQGCTSLASIDLPQATTFGDIAFQSCTKLTTITLPKATSINGSNFCYNCQALTALVITNAEKVCSLTSTSNAFANTPIKSGTGYIYVPDALVDSYKTATNWSVFADQIKPLSELPTE